MEYFVHKFWQGRKAARRWFEKPGRGRDKTIRDNSFFETAMRECRRGLRYQELGDRSRDWSEHYRVAYLRQLPMSLTMTAFCTCRRFSASSKISSACASKTFSVISSSRWAGRQ